MAAMIAIGALAYFGITSPPVPDKCLFSNNFGCQDYAAFVSDPSWSNKNTVKFILINGLGQTIYEPYTVSGTLNSGVVGSCQIPIGDWSPDNTKNTTCDFGTGNFLAKDKVKVKFTLTYKKTPTGYVQTASGELLTKAQ